MAKKNKSAQKKVRTGIKAKMREEHFASGGSLREWRGVKVIQTSRAEKRKDRKTRKNKAIRESEDE